MPTEQMMNQPFRVQTTLKKRHEGEDTPYETIETESWHESDGSEIVDEQRLAELHAAQTAREI